MGFFDGLLIGLSGQNQGWGGGVSQNQDMPFKSEVLWTESSGVSLFDSDPKKAANQRIGMKNLRKAGFKPYIRTEHDDSKRILFATESQHQLNIKFNNSLRKDLNTFPPVKEKTGFARYWEPTSKAMDWYFSPFSKLADTCGYKGSFAKTTATVLDGLANAATWLICPILPFVNTGLAMLKGGMDYYYA